jgi:hypothetical protein
MLTALKVTLAPKLAHTILEKKVTTRSEQFIVYFQLEAICRHLRSLLLNGIEPGPATLGIVKSLRDSSVGRTIGKASECIPEVNEKTASADLLAIAELVLATNVAFLSSEELEERARIGFHTQEDMH